MLFIWFLTVSLEPTVSGVLGASAPPSSQDVASGCYWLPPTRFPSYTLPGTELFWDISSPKVALKVFLGACDLKRDPYNIDIPETLKTR